jgi:hypothetical protein
MNDFMNILFKGSVLLQQVNFAANPSRKPAARRPEDLNR